jgi:hypothetical protein
MSENQPVVRRSFRYGKKSYKPGDVFEPEGNRNDKMILQSSLITYKSVGKAEDNETKRPLGADKQGQPANRTKQHRNRA